MLNCLLRSRLKIYYFIFTYFYNVLFCDFIDKKMYFTKIIKSYYKKTKMYFLIKCLLRSRLEKIFYFYLL